MPKNSIRNIIFDLGGVILNINPALTVDAFHKLGWKNFFDQSDVSQSKELFYNLESGSSSSEVFRDNVRGMIANQIRDKDIDTAWCAMILDIPSDRVRYLEELKKSYRLFLLSNTNEIHRIKFHGDFEADFGYSFYDLFEHNFYSHEMGMRKPNPLIYLQALTQAGLDAGQTLFIDDMEENILSAKTIGLKVLHIKPGTLMEKLPEYLHQNQG
jgi:HAD superfamily hydrolase (TIGR01509 family)